MKVCEINQLKHLNALKYRSEQNWYGGTKDVCVVVQAYLKLVS